MSLMSAGGIGAVEVVYMATNGNSAYMQLNCGYVNSKEGKTNFYTTPTLIGNLVGYPVHFHGVKISAELVGTSYTYRIYAEQEVYLASSSGWVKKEVGSLIATIDRYSFYSFIIKLK